MQKYQIKTASASSRLQIAFGAIIDILWYGLLIGRTAKAPELNAKIRYDIGEEDVRPIAPHGHGHESLEAMLRRSI